MYCININIVIYVKYVVVVVVVKYVVVVVVVKYIVVKVVKGSNCSETTKCLLHFVSWTDKY